MSRTLALLLVPCIPFCACTNMATRVAPDPSTPAVAESVLVARVNHALRAAAVPDYQRLQIAVEGPVVTLRGPVADLDVAERAMVAARAVDGVRRVVGCIWVEAIEGQA